MKRAIASAALHVFFAVHSLHAAGPGPESVWTPPADMMERLHAELERGTEEQVALERVMTASGAKPAAVAFSRALGGEAGYLGARATAGRIVTGTLYYPLRATNTMEPCMIDATGKLLRPAGPDHVTPQELSQHRSFRKLAHRQQLEAYPPRTDAGQAAGPRQSMDLIFEHPLRSCTNCPSRGTARVAYRFDGAGVYRNRRLLSIGRSTER